MVKICNEGIYVLWPGCGNDENGGVVSEPNPGFVWGVLAQGQLGNIPLTEVHPDLGNTYDALVL